jgi:hypothetical protein
MTIKNEAPTVAGQGRKTRRQSTGGQFLENMPPLPAAVKNISDLRLVYSRPVDPLEVAYFAAAKRFADLHHEKVQVSARIDEISAAMREEQAKMSRISRLKMEVAR